VGNVPAANLAGASHPRGMVKYARLVIFQLIAYRGRTGNRYRVMYLFRCFQAPRSRESYVLSRIFQDNFMPFDPVPGQQDVLNGGKHVPPRSPTRRFETTHKPRISRMRVGSRTNTWLWDKIDPDWVQGYDSRTGPLALA
jgi:hypothetical protein